MRLLDTTTSGIPEMREFVGSEIPPYAILSHTWGSEEVTLQQLTATAAKAAELRKKAGFLKIQKTCELARSRDGLGYAWVDTCCIDKTSSAELTEAINAMYAWYRNADVCYVYLADLEPGTRDDLAQTLRNCRWFTRGWTLQELIAPLKVHFFDMEWNYRGDKDSLAELLESRTGIPERLLRSQSALSDYSVARRMSWAAMRETTRLEDKAYCLLGIFDVNMPLIYGEGMKAFDRLQTSILQTTSDLSIFAWTDDRVPCPQYAGALAESPRQFAGCGNINVSAQGTSIYGNFIITNKGIQLDTFLYAYPMDEEEDGRVTVRTALSLLCTLEGSMLQVYLRKIDGGLYARFRPDILVDGGAESLLREQRDNGDNPLSLETIILSRRLPPRFPLFMSNPVVPYRHSALSLELGALVLDNTVPVPRSHWDDHDGIFFAGNSISRAWCAFWLSGRVSWARGEINILVACFHWNRGQARVMFADLNRVNPVNLLLLWLQLDKVRFESSFEAEVLVLTVSPMKLEQEGGTAKLLLRQTGSRTPIAEASLSMGQEWRPAICITQQATVLQVNITEPSSKDVAEPVQGV
ncbi:HET-domain-containing protein [Canariomyces notabilis]|uniref:HET-domain-containing protein n=1 Tax=Canariomyces notabilis TaxID=2074819 RepID=A0AAN6QH37_9PEZI|nr:HET-domain-containing protein [Canariomyces arenarius]